MRDASSCPPAYRAASWPLLFLLLLTGAAPVSAQLTDLSSFQDSVESISDVRDLRSMLAARSNRKAQSSPVALTERGFVALRLWDLTSDRSQSKLAEKSFKDALERDPAFGWAHYGLGLTYVSGPSVNLEKAGWRGAFVVDDVVAQLTGRDARSRAHRSFLQAIGGKPPIARAAEELAENAITKNKRNTLEDARTALEQRVSATPSDGAAWLALARMDAELGNLTGAAAAIKNALDNGVDDSEVARTGASVLLRIKGREAEGARLWLDGVNALDEESAEAYYDDIEALLSNSEKETWKSMSLDSRASFLREFWPVRAALGGVSVPERLAEHYRRLAYARTVYFRGRTFGAPVSNELRRLPFSQRSHFDDRGLIYVRHGEPVDRVGSARAIMAEQSMGDVFSNGIAESALLGYESWAYRNVDGTIRSFHFEGHGDDYHLMYKLPCNGDWLGDRRLLDPRFGSVNSNCDAPSWRQLSVDMRFAAFDALATDTDAPGFTKELPFFFDLYTFRALEGRTSVVAAVAVPREKLNLSAVAANPAYRIDLSLILVDTLSRHVVRQDDSVRLASQRAVGNDDLFRLHVEIAVPPSRSTVQRVIVSDPSEPGVGQLYGGPFPIPDYSGTKLMLSDIVLAEPSVQGRWHRGAVALALVPTRYFRGGSFNVFYEIYNINKDDRYSTEIEIEEIRKSAGQKLKGLFGGKNSMKISFDGIAATAANGTLQELRRVDAPLSAGTYRMRVMVKNLENGEVTRGEQTFSVPD